MIPEAEFVGYNPIDTQPVPAAAAAPVLMHPLRSAAYIGASTLLSMTQGLGMNLIATNIPQIQGYLGATNTETTWLVAAYMAPNVSLSVALIKIRNQYGLRNFAQLSLAIFVLVSLLHLVVTDLQSAIIIRFVSGIAAAPLSSLAFLYMLEAFTPARKMTIAICLVLTNISLASPLARLLSPTLLDIGQWGGLYTFEISLALIAFGVIYVLPLTPMPRAKVIEKLDIVSYFLIAIGFGCIAVTLVTGRIYWWFEAPWLGVLLAIAFATITTAVVIELNREKPLLDIRWIASKEIVHFAGTILLFRLVVSEQSTVANNFFQKSGSAERSDKHDLYHLHAGNDRSRSFMRGRYDTSARTGNPCGRFDFSDRRLLHGQSINQPDTPFRNVCQPGVHCSSNCAFPASRNVGRTDFSIETRAKLHFELHHCVSRHAKSWRSSGTGCIWDVHHDSREIPLKHSRRKHCSV